MLGGKHGFVSNAFGENNAFWAVRGQASCACPLVGSPAWPQSLWFFQGFRGKQAQRHAASPPLASPRLFPNLPRTCKVTRTPTPFRPEVYQNGAK